MAQSFSIVGTQVAVLFVLIALGFLAGKVKMLTAEGVRSMNDVMLYLVTPCVVIHAFQRQFEASLLKNLMLAILGSLISHLLCYFVGLILIRDRDESRRVVLRFALCFSNCGFMALPLLDALLGSEGVFYGAGYLAVFNLLVWSVGQYSMARGKAVNRKDGESSVSGFDMKKIIFNPTIIAVFLGLIFFFCSFTLPELIGQPVAYLAALNTPVPMLIIGYTISGLKPGDILDIRRELSTIFGRLILIPLLLLGILYLLGYRGNLLVSVICSASAPVAAITTMFALKFDRDYRLASKLVAVSSLFSILTMTVIISFAGTL